MINAVIFDFDGLLIDSEIISYEIYKNILKEYNYPFAIEEYAQKYSGKTEIKNIENLIETYKLPFSVETGLKKVLIIENKILAEGVNLKPGAKKLLLYLKNNHYKTAIATSSTKERALSILNRHNLTEYFDSFTFADEVKKGKPHPDIFLKACQKLNESPENCLVLEDSEAGIQSAYSAGIPVICIPDMKVPDSDYQNKAKLILPSLDKVIDILKKIESLL